MKIKAIILGLLCVHCLLFSAVTNAVVPPDPNDDPIALDNGLFEEGDPNLTEYDFTPPIYWQRIIRTGR